MGYVIEWIINEKQSVKKQGDSLSFFKLSNWKPIITLHGQTT